MLSEDGYCISCFTSTCKNAFDRSLDPHYEYYCYARLMLTLPLAWVVMKPFGLKHSPHTGPAKLTVHERMQSIYVPTSYFQIDLSDKMIASYDKRLTPSIMK